MLYIKVNLTPEIRIEQAILNTGVDLPEDVTSLAVTGTVTDDDFMFIRKNMDKTLQELDLSGASAEWSAFNLGCTGLVSITMPDSVVKIGDHIFVGCNSLASIAIHPDNPAYASENGVLFNRDKTELIAYPAGRQGDYAIPDTVVKIGFMAFQDCCFLSSIVIPDSVKEIGELAFWNCSCLTSVKIPDSVVKIETMAFATGCFPHVTIPASVIELGWCALHHCHVTVHPDNPEYSSEDGILFNRNKTELIMYPEERQGDYVIPDTVIQFGSRAFANCFGLTSVTIPNSVEIIGFSAFEGCTGLTEIVIPDSVTEIGHTAFSGCPGLKSVYIPASVVKIDDTAFNNCTAFFRVSPYNPLYESDENGKLQFRIKSASGEVDVINWTFADGVLTIDGAGSIRDYDDYSVLDENATLEGRSPWYNLSHGIKSIVFRGVGKRGIYMFSECSNLASVTFDDCNILGGNNEFRSARDIIDRAFHGYTLGDVRNMNRWFAEQAPRMLREFKRRSSESVPDGLSHEEWDAILARMIFCFSEMHPPLATADDDEKKAYREKMKKEGFELFCRYYNYLCC